MSYPPIEKKEKNLKLYTTFNHQRLLKVDEREQSITIDVKESTFWTDNRIKTTFRNDSKRKETNLIPKALNIAYPIWTPPWPLYVPNLASWESFYKPIFLSTLVLTSKNPITTNETIVNATLEWRITVFCTFDFTNYPLDIQHCPFHAEGAGSRSLKYLLYDPMNIHHSTKQYEAAGFDVTIKFVGNDYATYNETTLTNLTFFSHVFGFEVSMRRIFAPYLFQYYLPCMAIVIVSGISFIVPLSAIPGRIALVVTQFLTLTNIFIHAMVSTHFKKNYISFLIIGRSFTNNYCLK